MCKPAKLNRRCGGLGITVFLAGVLGAVADIVPPLYVGNVVPVVDQYGRAMRGISEPGAEGTRCRVEIRTAPYPGIRIAPGKDGSAHPFNPLVSTSGVGGIGMNVALPDSGIFCMVFPDRIRTTNLVFARVFNAPTASGATFYADSKAVAVPDSGSSLVFEFEAALPLDPDDHDGDGLNNSWEQVLGTSGQSTPDYDGDGMLDLHEMLAGTSPTDADSQLAFHHVRREGGAVPAGSRWEGNQTVRLKWQSVPGKRYQVQYSLLLNSDPVSGALREFNTVNSDPIVAGENETEIDKLVVVPGDVDTRMFRIRLVPDGE